MNGRDGTPDAREIHWASMAPTADRLPLASVADLAAIEALDADATAEQIERALLRVRESIPLDADRLTRATIRAMIRRRYPLVPSGMVDAALAPPAQTTAILPARAESHEATPYAITLTDDEPSVESVSGAVLLDGTAALIRRYVVMTEAQALGIALWVAATYLIDVLACMPILLVTAATCVPARRSSCRCSAGSCRGRWQPATTGAVLDRAIATHRPTLLADEVDTGSASSLGAARDHVRRHKRHHGYIPALRRGDARAAAHTLFRRARNLHDRPASQYDPRSIDCGDAPARPAR